MALALKGRQMFFSVSRIMSWHVFLQKDWQVKSAGVRCSVSDKYANWGELFRCILKNKSLVVLNSSEDLVRKKWDEYRGKDLISTAPFKLNVSQRDKDVLVKVVCSCCGKKY